MGSKSNYEHDHDRVGKAPAPPVRDGHAHAQAFAHARSLLPPMTGAQVHDPADAFVFILAYKHDHDGNSPTTRDMMEHLQISSSSVALNILRQLERVGLIRVEHQRSRAIRIPGGHWTWSLTKELRT